MTGCNTCQFQAVEGNPCVTRPFAVERLKPIQQPSTDLSDFLAAREQFTTDEWGDALLRSIGLEPAHSDFEEKRLNVRIPADLMRQAKAKAALQDKTISQVVRELLQHFVADDSQDDRAND